ncbi:invasion associated locus B family protein [Acidiphilium sp. AL]|uniref:Invasion associated locus B family protein n=1 Tax=Acidiphilium iwatense TaxID=768198 RepID=A0ABS9DQP2_9PROT|nr:MULTISPECIES: invasion associated locus B family protein [Acidiphilium]MCF3945083.1 invasion associated locus B family protein [Acidiphilium iwatense]MCU4160572.1 invasion associated locus B family protein [Acidiphilium sp. AL]
MKHAPALLLLAAVALPGLAVAAQTPAADAPKPLGVFKSWTAATYGTGADKACYAFATTKLPKGSKATPAMLTVTERAAFRDEISLSQGITYSKGAKVTLAVGPTTLKFFTKDNMAYAMKGAATTKAFLAGSSVTATATAPNAKPVTDTFGLDGFADAYKAIQKACPAASGAKTPGSTKTKS